MPSKYSCNGLHLCDKCRGEIRGEKAYASSVVHEEPFDGEKVSFVFHPGCNPVKTPALVAPVAWSVEHHVHDNAIEARKEKFARLP